MVRSASSSEICRRRPRISSNSPATGGLWPTSKLEPAPNPPAGLQPPRARSCRASATISMGCRIGTPAPASHSPQPGLALATTSGVAAGDDRQLLGPDPAGKIGLEGAVGAAGAAAAPVVVELDQVAVAIQHHADAHLAALHMAQVAGVLHRDARAGGHRGRGLAAGRLARPARCGCR